MKTLNIFMLCAALGLASCSQYINRNNVSLENWTPGTSHRFLVQVFENGTIADSSFERPGKHLEVSITLLDTVDGATIEWQEFIKDTESGEFTHPLTRIVYRTKRSGRFDHIINYAELSAYADTMMTSYLRMARADSAMTSALKASFLDSVVLVSSLTKHVRLFHYLYGATFSGAYDEDTASWRETDLFEPLPVFCLRHENLLCDADDELLSMVAWAPPMEVDATQMVLAFMGETMALSDSVGKFVVNNLGIATVTDSVYMCFAQDRGIPARIEAVQTKRMSSGTFTTRVHINLFYK